MSWPGSGPCKDGPSRPDVQGCRKVTAVTTLSAGRPQVCASRCSNEFSLYLPHFSASVSRRSHPISPGNGHIEGKRDDVSAPGNRQGAPPVRQGASTHLSTRVPRVSIWQPWALALGPCRDATAVG